LNLIKEKAKEERKEGKGESLRGMARKIQHGFSLNLLQNKENYLIPSLKILHNQSRQYQGS
jgi:hypothetical protein